ncbi:L-aspartate oxidase [Cronobacter dublinensis]|uniref:L-aspartate oxidase n=1 Tax=Cronobacter dublinensis TaxID=413497 RepID=A0A9Q4T7Y3_9ENTR|nr:L-aspartate oxidase [Cronobacter dublinensis]EGT5709503.1 L-aspartate oxidase [Cronobacter dublinensis subsp. dublinensis]CCJ85714.1 L-aspartate oxidase [Cronobacter dublinensis 582]EGT5734598.1 L-aspartate oxidase [Cronobacter dublinensis subsp. dublinensis]NCH58435.1 L-aspartate oxidase [Cronobacter dublinensis]
MSHACLVVTTQIKKSVFDFAFWCYAGQTLFSKLNTRDENDN